MDSFSTKTYTAGLVKKNSLPEADVNAIMDDVERFNAMVRASVVDLRKPYVPGLGSLHVRLKGYYGCTDYFATSVESAQKELINSAKECLQLRIEALEEKVSQMEAKIKKLEKSLSKMGKVKENLIARSLARENGAKVPTFKKSFGGWITTIGTDDGNLRFVVGLKSKSKKARKPTVYDNEYLFELNFVDPYIRKKKADIGQIRGRIFNTQSLLAKLRTQQKEQRYSICFGGRKLLREKNRHDIEAKAKAEAKTKANPVPVAVSPEKADNIAENEALQKAAFQRKRCRPMLLSGRADASQGNFVVRYDTKTHTLFYKPTTAKKGNETVVIPNVVFPYGQDKVNMAVDSHKWQVKNNKLPEDEQIPCWPRKPVSWTIQDRGNAFLIKCIVHEPDPDVNFCYSHGCVAFDINYNHFAVAELNDCGQLVWYKVVPFKMAGRTSNQIENAISEALEVIFKHAATVGKPVAMEKIGKIKKVSVYGNRKRNRKISQFAYKLMQDLAESKAKKYGLALRYVNPAYTSQIGKIKYMRPYGVSIHVAAAYVIGRRAMGFKEKVPSEMLPFISEYKNADWTTKWKAITNGLKGVNTHCFYKKIRYDTLGTMKDLKAALIA